MNQQNQGLAFLVGQAKGGEISTRCVKLKTLLDNKEYFIPVEGVDKVQPLPIPPFPVHAKVMYSEILIKNAEGDFVLSGIRKHEDLTIFGTGCIVEVADRPSWWAKRDSNGI